MDNYSISRSGIADILRGKSIDTEQDVKHVSVEIHKYLRSIDAVPVVRCKDCFWYDRGVCAPFSHEVEKSHFCAKGARKIVIHD